MRRAQLGLGHAYSRGRCAQDVNRNDKPIMQTVALIEQLDKDINTFCMRLKEWFAWHFPEMTKIVSDNSVYALLINEIEASRENVVQSNKEAISAVLMSDEKAQQVIDAAKISMGMDMKDTDALQIKKWAERCTDLIHFRESLAQYLKDRMSAVAPNLAALIGEILGAKLIAHSGGLTNLSKYPASTIQILGAEKALFRALKTKGKTPKYGLIFNSTFIGRAAQKNKGKISRYLANKCAIASRVDCFSEHPTSKFGESLKEQIEERLKFVANGVKPRKNKDAMDSVIADLKKEGLFYGDKVRVKKEATSDNEEEEVVDKKRDKKSKEKKDKKEKKEKKSKKARAVSIDSLESEEEVTKSKKAKKRSKHE